MPTNIEWVKNPDGSKGESWNPIRGTKGNWHCTKTSEGCRNCYSERMNVRFGGPEFKPGADAFRLDEKNLQGPIRWTKPRMVFTCSMTDLFHQDVPDAWIEKVFGVMEKLRRHTFVVLTKRADRMMEFCSHPTGKRLPGTNVWLGVTAENQETADERIPRLLMTPARLRFVSVEPMLGPVDLGDYLELNDGEQIEVGRKAEWEPVTPDEIREDYPKLDWAIVGGESGPKARPMHPDWARSLRDQCVSADVPYFFKQWGEWAPFENDVSRFYRSLNSMGNRRYNLALNRMIRHCGGTKLISDRPEGWPAHIVEQGECVGGLGSKRFMVNVGKKAAGCLLDGREWKQMPTTKQEEGVNDV